MGNTNQAIYNVNYQGVETNLTPPNHRTPKWLAWLRVLLFPLQWVHNNFFNDYANGSVYPFYNSATVYQPGNRVIYINNAVYECEAANVFNVCPGTNTGFATGSYSFTSAGGSDNLGNGTTINAAFYSGPNNVSYTITIASYSEGRFLLDWSDSQGNNNSDNPLIIVAGQSYALSFSLYLVFNPGTFHGGDTYKFTISTNVVWWQVAPDYFGVRPRTNYNGQKLVLEAILNQWFRTTFRQPATLLAPDIYIVNNNNYENTVFVCGMVESQSSVAVYGNTEAINFVEYSNSEYNFLDPCFTIYVPSALYWQYCGATGIASIRVDNEGAGYIAVPIISLVGGGGSGATAGEPFIMGEKITSIAVNDAGRGYTSAPAVVITAIGGDTTPAAAYAVPANTTQGDNQIKAIANKYVIAE